jgi:hypothetical protein
MKIEEIQERNYNATVKRGQIKPKTSDVKFLLKIQSEFSELVSSHDKGKLDPKELADIILVSLSFAKHKNIDIMKVMEEKVLFNETRKD